MKRFINEIKKKNIATLYMRMLNINMANRGCCKLLIYLQCVINYRRELAILATLISNVKQKNFLLLFFSPFLAYTRPSINAISKLKTFMNFN